LGKFLFIAENNRTKDVIHRERKSAKNYWQSHAEGALYVEFKKSCELLNRQGKKTGKHALKKTYEIHEKRDGKGNN